MSYHFTDLAITAEQQKEIDEKFIYVEKIADLAVDYFNTHILHTKDKWAGVPFILQPWQERIVRDLFGWRERETMRRRFKTLYLEVPRKNGKTDFAAGLFICLMVLEAVSDAEAYSIATKKEQAEFVFRRVKRMVIQVPKEQFRPHASSEFARIFTTFVPSVYMPNTGGSLKPLSSKPDGTHGMHTTYLLCDELHEWRDNELYTFVADGMAATYDPLTIKTTTAGKMPGVGWNEHNYALKVKKGILFNPRYLAVIFGANPDPKKTDYGDPKVWKEANPNFGISVDTDHLIEKWQKAQESTVDRRNFLRYHLNVWKEGGGDWLDMGRWDQCTSPNATPLDWRDKLPEFLRGRKCYGGLDLSNTVDLTAFILYFPPDASLGEKKGYVLCWFFLPEDNMERRVRRDRVDYDQWASMKAIELTEGDVVDYEVVRKRILEADQLYNIQSIAYDKWNAEETRQELEKQGLQMIKFVQGMYSYAGPTREFERRVFGRLFDHGNNPVLRWMASNVVPKTDVNKNMMPDKQKSTEKIDGIVSLIMAIGLSMQEPEEQKETYLNQDNLELLIL